MRKHMITIGTVRQAIDSLEKSDPVRKYLEEVIYECVHDSHMDKKQIMKMSCPANSFTLIAFPLTSLPNSRP